MPERYRDLDDESQSTYPRLERDLDDRPTREEVRRMFAEFQNEQLKWIIATGLTLIGIAVATLAAIIVAFC